MTSVRPSATLYREGAELDALLAELDDQHPGQVRVLDVTYGRDGGVLGFFAKRRVGIRYALDAVTADESADLDGFEPDTFEVGPRAGSALDDLLAAAEAAEAKSMTAKPAASRSAAESVLAESMISSGIAPEPTDTEDGAPNVEFARLLLDMALTKATQRRAAEEAARAAFVESGPHVPVVDLSAEPVIDPGVFKPVPVSVGKHAATPAAPAPVAAPPVVTSPVMTHPVSAPVSAPIPPVVAAVPAPLPVPVPAPVAAAPATREIWTAPPRRVSTATALAPLRRAEARPASPEVGIAELLRASRTRAVGAHRAVDDTTRTEFTLRRQLAELGVPISWIPEGASEAYWVVEQLCANVPPAPVLDLAPGSVLVIAGPAAVAFRLASEVCAEHRIDPASLVAAGCPSIDLPARRDVTARWHAREVVAATRAAAREPLVVVIDTDAQASPEADNEAWVAGLIADIAPDVLWTVVDATRKPGDLRRHLAALGRPSDALAVVKAGRTASPASVWELDVPIVSIDGRPATRGAWASLIINGLTALDSASDN